MANERKVFTSLDGLRGIAATTVVFRHVPDPTLALWSPGSYLAVDLFFVLSGFVLAHSYLQRLRSNMSVLAFMRVRLKRLYPLYLLGTLIAAPFVFHTLRHGNAPDVFSTLVEIAVCAALFLPAFGLPTPGGSPFPLNHPAWSLFYELLINLAFAFVAIRLTRRLIVAIVVLGLAALLITSVRFHGLDVGWQFWMFEGGLGRVVYSFFAGVGMYYVWKSGRVSWIKLPMPVGALLMLGVFMLEPSHGRAVYDFLITSIVFPALVLGLARHEPGPTLAWLCTALGRASYGIYVLQVAAIYVGSALVKRAFAWQSADHAILISVFLVAFTIVSAFVADRIFDVPVRAALTRRLVNAAGEPPQCSASVRVRTGSR